MNPEDLYPEIVSMIREEIFIEWAYIVLDNFTIIEKIRIKEIVFESDLQNLKNELKEKHGGDNIELITIKKDIEEDLEHDLESLEQINY